MIGIPAAFRNPALYLNGILLYPDCMFYLRIANPREVIAMTMKLAFSTLGYSGIEIRGLGEEIMASRAGPFLPGEINNTVKELQRLKLTIPCFSSNCVLSAPGGAEAARSEIGEYIELASQVGAEYIRVLADAHPAPESEVDDSAVASILKELATAAEAKNVTLLVETNGVYADTKRLAGLLKEISRSNVRALWDIHHPFRFFGERPEDTWMNLGELIRYIHVKDSVVDMGKVSYRLPGNGDLPLQEVFSLLREKGYDGYISLEWVKRWSTEIEDPAIVFPFFVHYVRQWEKISREDRLAEGAGEKLPPIPSVLTEQVSEEVPAISCWRRDFRISALLRIRQGITRERMHSSAMKSIGSRGCLLRWASRRATT